MSKIYEYGNTNAEAVLIQPVDDHDMAMLDTEIDEIQRLTKADFQLIAVHVDSWNHDLSPWKAPAVFGKEEFGSGAEKTLTEILGICQSKSEVNHRWAGIRSTADWKVLKEAKRDGCVFFRREPQEYV